MQVQIKISMDTTTRAVKVDCGNVAPTDVAFILSQIVTNILFQGSQQNALVINPMQKADGIKQ